MLDFIELFILGIGVGSFGALVGIGGGLIMVPLFMYFMMQPSGSTFANVQEVVGTSLFGVLLNALSGTLQTGIQIFIISCCYQIIVLLLCSIRRVDIFDVRAAG